MCLLLLPWAISICVLSPPVLRDVSCMHFFSTMDVYVLQGVVDHELEMLRIHEWVLSTLSYAIERIDRGGSVGVDGVQDIFDRFDTDGEGLNLEMFKMALEAMQIFLPRKDLEAFF